METHGRRWTKLLAAAGLAALFLGHSNIPWAAAKEKAAAAPALARVESAATPKEIPIPGSPPMASHAEVPAGMPAEEAMKMLLEGNDRVVKGKMRGPNRSAQRRGEVAGGQHPFAVIVACSDSRVPPELLFDQGYGDLFVVRTAGNVVDDVALGSIEYAVEHLGVRLIIVLGHAKCGAVKATVDGGDLPGHLPSIANAIQPAVEAARTKPGDLLANAVKANVKLVVQKIMESGPGFVEKLEDCVLRIAGGYYDLDTGKVQLTYQPVI